MLKIDMRGAIERRRVREAASAYGGSAEDEDVLELGQAPDALQPELRRPEHAPQLPRIAWQVLVTETASALEHRDTVSLFGQSQRGNAAAEAGSDDDPVEVKFLRHGLSSVGTQPGRPVEADGFGVDVRVFDDKGAAMREFAQV